MNHVHQYFSFLILLIALLTAFPTHAQVPPPAITPSTNIVVRGPGGATCSLYTSSPAANRALFSAWVQGFLTAYNQYVLGSGDIAGNMSNEQIFQGLDNYCQAYPQDNFQTAMSKLIVTFKGAVR